MIVMDAIVHMPLIILAAVLAIWLITFLLTTALNSLSEACDRVEMSYRESLPFHGREIGH